MSNQPGRQSRPAGNTPLHSNFAANWNSFLPGIVITLARLIAGRTGRTRDEGVGPTISSPVRVGILSNFR